MTEIRTRRLLLRRLAPDDAAALQREIADNDILRMLSRAPCPYRLSHAEAFIDQVTDSIAEGRSETFAITRRGAIAGVAGADLTSKGNWVLGYWIGKAWWGQGFATEAATALIRCLADRHGVRTIHSNCFVENGASARVLLKCGFVETGRGMLASPARTGPAPSIEFLYNAP